MRYHDMSRTLDSDVIMSTKTQNAVRIPIYLINEMQIIPAQRTIYKQMQTIFGRTLDHR